MNQIRPVRVLMMLGLSAFCGLLSATKVNAGVIAEHNGSVDPTTEGFSVYTWIAPVSYVGPVNDMGVDAWSLSGSGTSSIAYYQSAAFSNTHVSVMENWGFEMMLSARPILGLAPTYSSLTPYVVGSVVVGFGSKAFVLALGVDEAGNNVAILPTSSDLGDGGAVLGAGEILALDGLTDGYHEYLLKYDASRQAADLFVDGEKRLSDYSGFEFSDELNGLYWLGMSGGEIRVHHASIAVPEASSFVLIGSLGAGVAGFGAWRRRSKRKAGDPRSSAA